MNEITRIAVKRTMDPMQEVMNCLFEKNGDVFISDKILSLIKEAHSYTMIPRGNAEEYTFHKRVRGTDALFSFLVTTGPAGNHVSSLDCIAAELGLMEKHKDMADENTGAKVYVMLQDE